MSAPPLMSNAGSDGERAPSQIQTTTVVGHRRAENGLTKRQNEAPFSCQTRGEEN